MFSKKEILKINDQQIRKISLYMSSFNKDRHIYGSEAEMLAHCVEHN